CPRRTLGSPRWRDHFFFSSRRRHTRFSRDWSSDVCSSDLPGGTCVVGRTDRSSELLPFDACRAPAREFGVAGEGPGELNSIRAKIGRASCRERAETAVGGGGGREAGLPGGAVGRGAASARQ